MKHLGFHTLRDRKTDVLSDKLSQQLKSELNPALSDEELFSFADFNADRAERGGYSGYSYWGSTLRAFFQNKVAVFFLIVMLSVLTFTLIQPYLPGQKDPLLIHNDQWGLPLNNVAPCGEFWFGTNAIGQDLWARIWAGTRTSLFIGFTVAMVEAVVGILVGVLWGYVRKLDFFFTELYNVLDNIPQTLLLILISYVMKPGVSTIIFALCLTGWLGMARFIRNQIIIIRDRDYNLASRCLGVPTWRIIVKNLLPYLVSVITMRMALAIPSAIGNEVFVTYIGIGLPVDTPSLGNLIQTGRSLMTVASLRYQLFFPVLVLVLITTSFYLIGNAFADAADPKNHVK
ncbi:MAG: ABC transporter permease [Clostridiales bacterium]|nr:ABC transporter permease [Clostridiales bacterium]MDD7387817.1 ABC transporter permease [Bacillota bacterium]MDY6041089.1 ABC transporter permease [Candidatus Faecousia sp.]